MPRARDPAPVAACGRIGKWISSLEEPLIKKEIGMEDGIHTAPPPLGPERASIAAPDCFRRFRVWGRWMDKSEIFPLHLNWHVMTGRVRTDRGTSATMEEVQVWQAVRAQLRGLDSARSSSLSGYEKLLKASSDAKNMDALYAMVERYVQEEHRYVLHADDAGVLLVP